MPGPRFSFTAVRTRLMLCARPVSTSRCGAGSTISFTRAERNRRLVARSDTTRTTGFTIDLHRRLSGSRGDEPRGNEGPRGLGGIELGGAVPTVGGVVDDVVDHLATRSTSDRHHLRNGPAGGADHVALPVRAAINLKPHLAPVGHRERTTAGMTIRGGDRATFERNYRITDACHPFHDAVRRSRHTGSHEGAAAAVIPRLLPAPSGVPAAGRTYVGLDPCWSAR